MSFPYGIDIVMGSEQACADSEVSRVPNDPKDSE